MQPISPKHLPLTRRGFIAASGMATAASLAQLPTTTRAADEQAADVVAGKDTRLLVHNSEIAVLETPPELLSEQVTPLSLLFVRNNGQPTNSTTLEPGRLPGWNIELQGGLNKEVQLDAEELLKMPQVQHEMVLQCCGNGRALFAQSVKAKGTQWLRGGMGNIVVKGVRLSDVLAKHGVTVNDSVKYLSAEGSDPPPPGKDPFEHSLPITDALQHSILALEMNGKSIPAAHGGPVRLMTPGFYGTMHIKWVRRLRFDDEESSNKNHLQRYRTPNAPIAPGSEFSYGFENSTACWRMKLKCVVLSPAANSTIPAGQDVVVRGVAFNDGRAAIDAVLLSTDQGRTWERAQLKVPTSPFAWYRWELPIKLQRGSREVWARAVDGWGRSQPLNGSIAWNPSGYEWNGVEKIRLTVA